jgi:uncharacterized repeat protein (TIGR01451 family)
MTQQRTLTFALACFASLRIVALQVDVLNQVPSACGNPTGIMQAMISGGVPPYTIAWNTGATTEIITDLLPGTYSVTVTDFVGTQVVGQGDVGVTNLQQGGQTYVNLAHCPGGFPMAELTLFNQAQFGAYIWGAPPFTITGPAEVESVSVVQCTNCFGMDSLVRVEMNVPPGSMQTITWQDANGCPGESVVIMSTEAVWPSVFVYDVQGSCAGGNNGSFFYSVSPLSAQPMTLRIFRPTGSLLASIPITSGTGGGYGQLSPGTYVLKVVAETNGPFDDELCWDQTSVLIEDLGSGCANVNGPVFIDGNTNCSWQFNENKVPQAIVEFTPGPYYATTNAISGYSVNLPLGTYDHTVIHPGVQQECPGPFTLTGAQSSVTRAIGCSSLFPLDAQVTGCNGPARPGFQLYYGLNLRNNTAANAGNSTFTLEFDPLLSFISASPTPSTVVGNTVTWNLTGIGAYASTNRFVHLQVPPDISLIGTTLTATATVTTTNTDAVPANNIWTAQQVITAAYDPNDKLARTSTGQSDEIYFIDQDEWIDYVIRFQNTGTDTAFNVVITDTLPTTLDPATLDVGAASHAFNWSLSGHGIITFNFPSILLPDSNVNEPLSHGFVGFRIRPRLPLLPGTSIENIANIYFDFNPPVITEPSVLVAEFSTGVLDVSTSSVRVHPNPASTSVRVVSSAQPLSSIRILGTDGRVVRMVPAIGMNADLDVSTLGIGAYIIEAASADGSVHRTRFIKQ